MTMFYSDLMKESVRIYGERGKQYGDMQESMNKTASIASLIVGRTITPLEVALVMHAVKMARLNQDIYNPDTYLDGINYLAIAGELALTSVKTTQPIDQIDQDIAILAAKFAPRRPVDPNAETGSASS
jgi:hypothetical protein